MTPKVVLPSPLSRRASIVVNVLALQVVDAPDCWWDHGIVEWLAA